MNHGSRTLLKLGSLLLTLGLLHLSSAPAHAQDPGGKPRDDALDSLLEDLKKDEQKAPTAKPAAPKPGASQAKGKDEPTPGNVADKAKGSDKAKPAGAGRDGKPPKADEVSGKDKELDDLLEKLGESKDEPAPEERRPGGPGGDQGKPEAPGGGSGAGKEDRRKPGAGGLEGKDKELDEKLEEFAGIKRKKKREGGGGGGEGSGPTSEIIKQMREVEQRLGKQEAGGETQARQKEIVKKLETLIEQVKQSGSSGSKTIRMVQQQGQKPGGQQPGQEPGKNPGGAPMQKPAKPSDRHAMAGGKDIWGHLPPELRQEMENVFKEEALPTMTDVIKRYYLSVAKQKLVRGE